MCEDTNFKFDINVEHNKSWRTDDNPQRGRGRARVTHFACATLVLEKFRNGMPTVLK